MVNLMAFLSWFVSYLLLFGIIVALVIVSCFIGIRMRKAKDAKAALEKQEEIPAAQQKN